MTDPASGARFIQFIASNNYRPVATAAMFIAAGLDKRFTYHVAREIGNRNLDRWIAKARAALNDDTLVLMPLEEPPAPPPTPRMLAAERGLWGRIKRLSRKGKKEVRDAFKKAIKAALNRNPWMSDRDLAMELTTKLRTPIARRTVTKYRLELNINRDGVTKAAIKATYDETTRPLTDEEAIAIVAKKLNRPPLALNSFRQHRLELGIRHNRPKRNSPAWHAMLSEKQRQVHAANPTTEQTRRKMSESAKRRHALKPQSEETRRRIAAATKASWEKRLAKMTKAEKANWARRTCGSRWVNGSNKEN